MCIISDSEMLKKERAKTGRLVLWKVIGKDNTQGVWSFTQSRNKFSVGGHTASPYASGQSGQFHCSLTRKGARQYRLFVAGFQFPYTGLKIIKVYACRKDIVDAGIDEGNRVPTVTVSKLTIKSLKHQR